MPGLDELPDEWRFALTTIRQFGTPSLALAKMPAWVGGHAEWVFDLLADLDVAGLLAVWDAEDAEPSVTLTPYAAALLGVRLVERLEGLWLWVDAGEPDPSPPRAAGTFTDGAALDRIADPAPGPEAIAEARDEAESKIRKQRALPWRQQVKPPPLRHFLLTDGLPWPLIFLGKGTAARPWSELPIGTTAADCGSCRGRSLRPLEYCEECDRWGLNGFRPAAPPKPPKAPKRPWDSHRAKELERLQRERERAQRKAKRKQKRRRAS